MKITFHIIFIFISALFCRYGSNQSQLLAAIGTTAEIFSMKEESEAGITTLRIKATGRQRFRIKELRRQVDGWVSSNSTYFWQKLL